MEITALNKVLADSYALYLKTQNYHWNVTGPQFYVLHQMFEAQYEDLASAVDTLAERIRALGFNAPGSFSAFQSLTAIQEPADNLSAESMLKDLIADHAYMITALKKAIAHFESAQDPVTADLLVSRCEVHEQTHWMFTSSMA